MKHTPSILQKDWQEPKDYFTGSTSNLECHHVINGAGNRKKAEEYGLWIWVSHDTHEWIHKDQRFDLKLKQHAQRVFEEMYSHAEWMNTFHKNYLGMDSDA